LAIQLLSMVYLLNNWRHRKSVCLNQTEPIRTGQYTAKTN